MDFSTPIQAMLAGQRELAVLLYQAMGEHDLWSSAAVGDLEALRNHLSVDSDLRDEVGPDGYCPLALAILGNHYECARSLLLADCDPDKPNLDNLRPIHFACDLSDEDSALRLFALLHSTDARLNVYDDQGNSPLHFAARRGWSALVRSLLRSGADPLKKNGEGLTPLDLARLGKHGWTLRVLEEAIDQNSAPGPLQVIPSSEVHQADEGWLRTRWLFSFSHYYDPRNIQFGALRVFNDDQVMPHNGFGTHGHSESEIVTIMLGGELTHEDSLGNHLTIGPNEVQRMSAGKGIRHSEMNQGTAPSHLYQIWFYPEESGLDPSWQQRTFAPSHWENRLGLLVSPHGQEGSVKVHCDANVYRCSLKAGLAIEQPWKGGRWMFIYVRVGHLDFHGHALKQGDQLRLQGCAAHFSIKALQDSEFILIDLAPAV